MASYLKLHIQTFKTTNHSSTASLHHNKAALFASVPFTKIHHHQTFNTQLCFYEAKSPSLSINSSLSPSSSAPPSSKEEAILQAKSCISTTLEKPLNNPKQSTVSGKFKKLKQPRFQVEIPIIDDSPSSVSQLALELFKDLSIKRKGSKVKTLILWPNTAFKDTAIDVFQSHSSSSNIEHFDVGSVIESNNRSIFGSFEVAVFLAPESSQLSSVKMIADSLYPKPVVIVNPRWGFEEEDDFGELNGFIGSFEVIYSFLGLEVKGILSKRKGVIFKCVRDGVLSGEKWRVLVEEEGGEMKAVSTFKTRPTIVEVETVLYNLMAINSPITKSAKFLKDLVSNVTGKNKK